ncbi:g4046 [Coccomyxa viridis]|uniref:G4038 protein n=1 Tax=Coccomyxa viridis TaxID=1274662 RepID=A0ABP1FPD3_9CHLO
MAPASPDGESAGTRALTDIQTGQIGSTPVASAEPKVSDPELRLGRPSLKRKEVESSGNRFKIVSQLVIAMKRFQASLNPTYTYGKRPSPTPSSSAPVSSRSMRRNSEPQADIPEVSSASQQGSGDKAANKAPRPRTKHGHKTDYLFGALLPSPGEFRGGRPPTPDRAGSRPSEVPKSSSMRSVSTSSS